MPGMSPKSPTLTTQNDVAIASASPFRHDANKDPAQCRGYGDIKGFKDRSVLAGIRAVLHDYPVSFGYLRIPRSTRAKRILKQPLGTHFPNSATALA